MTNLREIGFYTLSDERACNASENSQLTRCELVLTARCNFKCPYCRHIGGKDMDYNEAKNIVINWAKEGLQNIRFSGGEPTLYPKICELISLAKELGIKRIAISTNGSATTEIYQSLIDCGVNDFSVSLDACCAEDGDFMAGGIKGSWETVIKNIKWLSQRTYVTVGVVLTDSNVDSVNNIITFADSLGVSDIRIIPAAQNGNKLQSVQVDEKLLAKYPILRYRINNIQQNKSVRGLSDSDSKKCGLVLDDMAICKNKHYPCIIYMRESGKEIGEISENMRKERKSWYDNHNTHLDPICKSNCLDVCIDYNNKFAGYRVS
jgi:molybdenum cofactor biosynthesis enzyme MoaA